MCAKPCLPMSIICPAAIFLLDSSVVDTIYGLKLRVGVRVLVDRLHAALREMPQS